MNIKHLKNNKVMIQIIKDELIGTSDLQQIKNNINAHIGMAVRNIDDGVNTESNIAYRGRAELAKHVLSKVDSLHRLFQLVSDARCIELTNPDSEEIVFCTAKELEKLNKVNFEFQGVPIYHTVNIRIAERFNEQSFEDLNKPATGKVLDTSVWGDDGYMSNKEADNIALSEYGVYFNVLIFLDGCQDYFRTTGEE